MILDIFYRFTKDAVIHQLKEVFLKVVFRFSCQLGVKVYIFFQPGAFFKFNTSVNFCDFQTETFCRSGESKAINYLHLASCWCKAVDLTMINGPEPTNIWHMTSALALSAGKHSAVSYDVRHTRRSMGSGSGLSNDHIKAYS